ncbi:hypothetical protein [Bosea psychrotolerans]|uniref:Uncharacterized protein n=1 Tax=Bosea psychrotolerans TaxID=1871628 RepID=A0A2S4LSZ1_9HYPH|nr:hypothetical protein [Bosea psychrotolerans]POR45550.1 hypothetical protein CYD53_1328 [Bosea psychrotolerans]
MIRSALSRAFTIDGMTVRVEIYRPEGSDAWVLELLDGQGCAIMWEETFATDQAAFEEFVEGVRVLGLARLIDLPADETRSLH